MATYTFQADAELQKVIEDHSETVTFKKGHIIFNEGDPVRGIFLVIRGKVELLLHSAGLVTLIRRAGVGCLLGVPASINHHPYSLTARVTEDAELRFISVKALALLMRKEPKVTMCFVEMLSREVRTMRQVIAHPEQGISR